MITNGAGPAARKIAGEFVAARQSAVPLPDFPGDLPATLDDAYVIQTTAIDLWDGTIGGWKVGRIPVAVEAKFGIDRLAGPIFEDTIKHAAAGSTLEMPIFDGGFAAIEAEYVAVLGADAPTDKVDWSVEEAAEMISELRIGLEIASSPLATINDLGPTVVVSDFGNNLGLVVGPVIRDWRERPLDSMHCESSIDGRKVGTGGAFTLTGGFVRSVQFLLELSAWRGIPLRKGDAIATGQTTGIHSIAIGQTGTVNFGDDGRIDITAVAAPTNGA